MKHEKIFAREPGMSDSGRCGGLGAGGNAEMLKSEGGTRPDRSEAGRPSRRSAARRGGDVGNPAWPGIGRAKTVEEMVCEERGLGREVLLGFFEPFLGHPVVICIRRRRVFG